MRTTTNSRAALGALLATASIAVQAQAALGSLSLQAFEAAYAKQAAWEQQAELGLQSCTRQRAAASTRWAFACKGVGPFGLTGITESDGRVSDVSVVASPDTPAAFHVFRRVAQIAVRVARADDRASDAGMVVAGLLSEASKQPGKTVAKEASGLKFRAAKDVGLGWNFSVEVVR